MKKTYYLLKFTGLTNINRNNQNNDAQRLICQRSVTKILFLKCISLQFHILDVVTVRVFR